MSSAKIEDDAQKQKLIKEGNLAKQLFDKTIKIIHSNNLEK
jgi:hypothetical protein